MINCPLVSVIIPVYNHEKFVKEAIQSVLDQTYSNIELILVNDGSIDQSEDIARSLLEKEKLSFRIITQNNAGAHAAINQGIKLSQGEYLAILNSDDYYYPNRISKMISEMQKGKNRFAYSKVKHIDSLGNQHSYQIFYERQIAESCQFPTVSFELLRNNIAVTSGNFVFHRSLIDEVGLFSPYVTVHDWDFLLRVLLVEQPIFISEELMAYRVHSQGTLQANLDLVNSELAQIFVNYLSLSNKAKNLLAPSRNNWGDYWLFFSQTYMNRIHKIPEVMDQLNLINGSCSKVYQDQNFKPNYVSKFVPKDKLSDLDLTQINLQSISPKLCRSIKNSPRILFIIPWMAMGGAERFLLNMMDRLLENGWELSILCTAYSENFWKSEFEKRSEKIIVLPEILSIKHYFRFIRYWIERFEFDVIMLQGSLEGYRFLPIIKRYFPQISIIDYLHFVTPDWMDGGFPRLSIIYRDCLDMTIASCEQVKQWMMEAGAEESRLLVNPIGVDQNKWKPDPILRLQVREDLGIQNNEVVILYAARLEVQKQPLVFAKTMHLLNIQGINFRAIVAGDGSMRSDLEDFISKNKLSGQVRFLGSVPEEEMQALYNACDIFFLPSQNEGISSAIYEAMAIGIPIVGANVGGQSELVTPECGVLLPALPEEQQPIAYAKNLITLIKDSDRREKMKKACIKKVLNGYTLHQTSEKFIQIVNTVIEKKQSGKKDEFFLSSNELFLRNSQHIIEYLQARQEWHKKNNQMNDLFAKYHKLNKQIAEVQEKYIEAIAPKPASYWFYLWIRQMFLPIITKINNGKEGLFIRQIKQLLKKKILKI